MAETKMPENDITNIKQQQTTTTNNVSNIEQEYTFMPEVQQAKEQAIQDVIAGTPRIPTLKHPANPIKIDKPEITSSFTTRDQVMSKLNLMDEEGNYTDTYTNYISQGGLPVPGYEYAHEELLKQERYDAIFQQVTDGTMSYDTALMEAYGRDILAASFNIDVTSVAWWTNKYLGKDYSNPFDNQYLMAQVKDAAQSFHESRLASQYAKTNLADTQLGLFIGQDLEMSQARTLFPQLDELSDKLDDTQFMRALHNGQIAAQARMTQDTNGTWYYLHTDGEVYVLDGQGGENHGTLKTDADGNFTGIDLNNSGVASFGRSAVSGFASVFTGIVDLALMATDLLCPFDMWDDDSSNDGMFSTANDFDAWMHDNASFLVDNGYVDLDSSKLTGQDIANLGGSIIGTIVGTMTLAGIVGGVGDAGTAASTASKGSGLIGWGDDLIRTGHTVSGHAVKGAGTALKWQTGNIGTNKGGYANPFVKELWSNGTNLQVWGRRLGASTVANAKNAFNDYRYNMIASDLYDDSASRGEIVTRTVGTFLLNTAIDTFISGGMDDNQVQAWTGSDFLGQNTDDIIKASAKLDDILRNHGKEQWADLIEKNASGEFKKLLKGRALTIGVNSGMDLVGNMLTGAISSANNLNAEGQYEDFLPSMAQSLLNPSLIAQSTINTLWYSTRGQIKDWNAGIDSIGSAHKELIATLDGELAKYKNDPKNANIIATVKAEYIKDIQNDTSNQYYEGKIIKAMDNLSKNLSKDGKVPEIISKAIKKAAGPRAFDYYKNIYEQAQIINTYQRARQAYVLNPAENKHKFFKIFEPLKKVASWASGEAGAIKNIEALDAKQLEWEYNFSTMFKDLVALDAIEVSSKVNDIIDSKNPDMRYKKLQCTTGVDIKKSNKKLYEALVTKDSQAANKYYYVLPNNEVTTEAGNASKNALDTCVTLGYIKRADVEGQYVYEVQPVFTPLDFVNTSIMTDTIYNSVVALEVVQTPQEKAEILNDLGDVLFDSKTSSAQVSAILTKVLDSLVQKQEGKNDSAGTISIKKPLKLEEAYEIFEALQSKGKIVKVTNSNSQDMAASEAYKRFTTVGDILLKIQKGKGNQIDISDTYNREILKQLAKEGRLTESEVDELMNIYNANPELFLDGNQLNKSKYIKNEIRGTFSEMVPDEKQQIEKDTEHDINLYLLTHQINKENNKEFYDDVVALAKEYDNLMAQQKSVNINDDVVYIDLTKFNGNSTSKFLDRIIREGLVNSKHLENTKHFKTFESDMTTELERINKWRLNNGSLIKFNLNSSTDIDTFKTFMEEFNYSVRGNTPEAIKDELLSIQGVTSHYGTTAVLNISQVKDIAKLQQEIFDSSYITLANGDVINVKDIDIKDLSGSRITNLDLINEIINRVEVQNIDPRLRLSLINSPEIALIPLLKESAEEYWEPMSVAILGEEKSPEKIAGKASKTLTTVKNKINKRTAGKAFDIDPNLEKYFILDIIAKSLTDNKEGSNIPSTTSEIEALTKAGLIGEDKIWYARGNKLILNSDYDDIINKILDPDFNVYELLPMAIYESDNSKHGITDLFATHSVAGAERLLPGRLRETGLRFLSERLPWDDANNSIYAAFIGEVINHRKGLKWNPIKDSGFKAEKAKEAEDYNTWLANLQNSNNPYDILTRLYIDNFPKLIQGKADKEEYNNETLLLAYPHVRNTIIDMVNEGEVDSNTAVNRVRAALNADYLPAKNKTYQSTGVYNTVSPVLSRATEVDNVVLVSGAGLAEALGGYRNIKVADDNIEWVDLPTIQKAYDLVKDIIENQENIYRASYISNYYAVRGNDSDALKLFKGAAANNGYIPIQDVDEIANIIAENYKQVADGKSEDFKIKQSIVPSLIKLWGNNYNKEVEQIFKVAKQNIDLNKTTHNVFYKHFVSPGAASMQVDYKNAIGRQPERDANGNYISLNDPNAKTLEALLNNRIDNELNDPRSNYHKMLETADGLLFNEISDSINRRTMEDRILYTSAPYNSEVQNLSARHNNLGLMHISLQTFHELKLKFPDGNEEELMKLAVTLTNLNAGVTYAGERAQFIVVDKNGNLTSHGEDMLDKYASANLHELLFNIHKAKDKLIGCTIITADKQELSNTSGLHLKYNTISSERDFNKLTQKLFENFLIDNAYYLQKGIKHPDDAVTFTNKIMGTAINPKELQTLLDNIPSHNMSQRALANKQYTAFQKRTGYKNVSKVEFMSLTKTLGTIDTNQISDEAINDLLNISDSGYSKNIGGLRGIIDLAMGGNPDFYSQDRKRIINQMKEKIMPTLEDEATDDIQQQTVNFILKELVDRGDSPILRYLTSNDKLLTMKQEVESGVVMDAFFINADPKSTNKTMPSSTMKALLDSLTTNDPTIRTAYRIIVSIDAETGLKLSNLENNQGVFEVGLSIKILTETGWEDKHYDIYIDYSGKKNITPQEITEYVNKWSEVNIPEGHPFLQKEGFKKSLDNFKNISTLTANDANTLFLKPEEFKAFLGEYLGNETILLGYNSSKADIPWMKASGLLTDDMLKTTTHVDVKVLGDTSQILSMKNQAKLESRAIDMRVQNTEAHSGINDARVTMNLFTKIAASTYNISGIKNYAYRSLETKIKNSGLNVDDETLNKALHKVDDIVTKAQEGLEIEKYFDKDIGIDPSRVASVTELFEFALNRQMANMTMTVREQMIKDDLYSDIAKRALENSDYHKVHKLWSFAESKEIELEDLLKAINIEMKLNDDFMTMNNLIEVISDDVHIYRILDRLGLDNEEFDKAEDSRKHIFTDDPYKDSRLDYTEFEKDRMLKDIKPLVDGLKTIAQEMNISNDIETQELLNDLATLYDFREDLDISEVTKPNVKLLNTKLSKLFEERLKNHYGDVDAVVSFQQKGIYQLIGSQPVGQEIVDMISGEKITVDSSMIVLSQGMFERLVKDNIDNYIKALGDDKEVYSQLLIHPADANNKILPRRIVVNEKLPGFYMRVPETVIEVLGSRDFDGDHLILLEPRQAHQKVLKLYANNMYQVHNIQERALNFLRKIGKQSGSYDDTTFISVRIGKDQEIIDICREADYYLSRNRYDQDINTKEFKKLTERFNNRVDQIIKSQNLELSPKQLEKLLGDINKDLWLTEFKGYEKTGQVEPIRYINNPAVQALGNALTYSGNQRIIAENMNLVDKYLFSFIDKSTGMTEKYAIRKMRNIPVSNAWTDLLASGIYGSHTLYKYFSNMTENEAKDFCADLENNIVHDLKDSGAINYKDVSNTVSKALNAIPSLVAEGKHAVAFQEYATLLQTLEDAHTRTLDSKDIMNALTSDEMKAIYASMEDKLKAIEKNIEIYNEMKKNEIYFPSDSLYGKVTGYTLNEAINQMYSDVSESYNRNLFASDSDRPEGATEVKAFVITGFGDASDLPKGKIDKVTSEAMKKATKHYYEKRLEFLKDLYNKKDTLLRTGHSQNPETPEVYYDFTTRRGQELEKDIETTRSTIWNEIVELETFIGSSSINEKDLEHFFETHPKIKELFEANTPIGIAEDSILINSNRNKTNKLVGYTKNVYEVPEGYKPLADIEVGKFYDKGTKITNGASPLILKHDSYIVDKRGKTITTIQVTALDNRFKDVTDFGGKSSVDSSYRTDEDIDILITRPTFNKIVGGYQEAVEIKEESRIIFDEYNKPILVKGYVVDKVHPVLTESTVDWDGNKDRKMDALHIMSDANTINAILEGFVKYDEETDSLTTNVEKLGELTQKVYKPHNDIQIHNALGTYNKMKFLYMFERLSESEVQQEFNSEESKDKILETLISSPILASDIMTSYAYTLGKDFEDRINTDFGKRLFSDTAISLIGEYLPTKMTDFDTTKAIGKDSSQDRGSIRDDGTSSKQVSLATIAHMNMDDINSLKDYKNFEDYYMSSFKLLEYLLDKPNIIDSFKARELIGQGKLPVGRFIADTATPENDYRHHNVMYTINYDKQNKLLKGVSDSSKTAITTTPADVVGVNPVRIPKMKLPTVAQQGTRDMLGLAKEVVNLIMDPNSDTKVSNVPKIANMIRQLELLTDSDSVKNKISSLNNTKKEYRIYDDHLAVVFDENGMPTVKFSKHVPLTGTLEKLNEELKGSTYNYAFFNSIDADDSEHLDASALSKTIKKDPSKGRKQFKAKKEAEAIFNRLQKDLYNPETGEVNTDFKIRDYKTDSELQPSKVLSGGERATFRTSIWGRQGVAEDTETGVAISTALKNRQAASLFFQQDALRDLSTLKSYMTSRMSEEEIKKYATCHAIYTAFAVNKDNEELQQALKYHKITPIGDSKTPITTINELKEVIEQFNYYYPELEHLYSKHVDNMKVINTEVGDITNEPFGKCLLAELAPYRSTSPEYNKAKAVAAIKTLAGIEKYNPINAKNKEAATLEFDLWNSSEAIIKSLADLYSLKTIKDTLEERNLLSNASLLDDVSKLLDEAMKGEPEGYIAQTDEIRAIHRNVINTIYDLTDIDIPPSLKAITVKGYKDMYEKIDNNLQILLSQYYEKYGTDTKTYTDFETISRMDAYDDSTLEKRNDAKTIANFYYAKMLCGQSLIQSSKQFASLFTNKIQSLTNEGYCLVNSFGQKYVKGGFINPISDASTRYLLDNIEVQYNSRDDASWTQFMLEKIISGEVFLMQRDIADHFDNKVYTNKIPNGVMKVLKTISTWSAALQMALPSKMINRLISFTGFDYSMGFMYDPKVLKYAGLARRELLAAFQSNGSQMSPELREYMIREGQPVGLTGKDPLTFDENLSGPENVMKVLNKLTDPLEFQNHLGRYAIYRAAKESFDSGKPNYGPAYFAKEGIDALSKNEDKAMFILDYILGTPGGFPELAKKTSGLMLYATFPLNFTRTMGAYGMSLAKLFKEGLTETNKSDWWNAACRPSLGLVGITGMSMAVTALICELLGIEDEEKEKMVKSLATIDIVGTVIGGTPTLSSSSMNPAENIHSMVIEPFTNTYNENLLEKTFGFVNKNIISHLNPAIKIPLEVATGYDFYGSSLMTTKYSYNKIENGLRKALGFVIGTSTANSIVDTYKINSYEDDTTFLETLGKGITRGISASLGNQKNYKKDTTNYYNNISALNSFRYKLNNGYSTELEDLVDVESMERLRNYSNKYGDYDAEDYKRISALLKKMMKTKEEPSTIYSLIVEEYNSGVSEATLKVVLNNNSLVRKFNQLNKQQQETYLNSLSSKEYANFIKALQYENDMYPMLQKFFPNGSTASYSKKYLNYRKPYYTTSSGKSGSYTPYPTKRYPNYLSSPYTGYRNKYKSYNPYASIDRVDVSVSPQMGIWKNDFNAIPDMKRNNWYLNNPYYNNLSDYEKRQKGGN